MEDTPHRHALNDIPLDIVQGVMFLSIEVHHQRVLYIYVYTVRMIDRHHSRFSISDCIQAASFIWSLCRTQEIDSCQECRGSADTAKGLLKSSQLGCHLASVFTLRTPHDLFLKASFFWPLLSFLRLLLIAQHLVTPRDRRPPMDEGRVNWVTVIQ